MNKQEFLLHDFYATSDAKIRKIIRKHRALGYGIFWVAVEVLYRNNGFEESLEDLGETVAEIVLEDAKAVNSVLDSCLNVGLFLRDTEGRVFSERILRALEERKAEAEKKRQNALKRWRASGGNGCNSNASAMQVQCNDVDVAMLGKGIKSSESNNNNKLLRFTPPTIDEVRQYCKERENNINPEAFIDYYKSRGWMLGRNPMKDWKASIRTWERTAFEKSKTDSKRDGLYSNSIWDAEVNG